MDKIVVKEKEISITGIGDGDYVSLTDIARIKNEKEPKDVIKNWLRNRFTLEYVGLWEKINNPEFKGIDFDPLILEAGSNAFTMSATRLINDYNAIGFKVIAKKGGGTYAHKDLALEFASWISPEVKLYIIKEFQRLKMQENNKLGWEGVRISSKLNYLILTSAIDRYLISIELTPEQISYVYASEADLINVAIFGKRASEWKKENPDKAGNIRDYANIVELAILSNLEFYNSKLIEKNVDSKDRIVMLNKEANIEKEIFNKNHLTIQK